MNRASKSAIAAQAAQALGLPFADISTAKCHEIKYGQIGPDDAVNCAHSCSLPEKHKGPHRCYCYPLKGSEWRRSLWDRILSIGR